LLIQTGIVISFIKYAIFNSFQICKVIKGDISLAEIVDQINRVKRNHVTAIKTFTQKGIGNLAFFFSIFFPSIWGRNCFFSSLLIMKWSYSCGLTPKLNIGLRPDKGDIEGHAWLSLDNKTFCERTTLSENYTIKLSETEKLIFWYNEDG